MDCVFCKIVNREVPAKILYEDEDVLVFPDNNPVRAVHILAIPKQHIGEFVEVADQELFGKLFSVVQRMVSREGLKDKGYRVIMNGGGAQLVNHLHIHLMGPMSKTAVL